MLFNSYEFIFAFLPITFLLYFLLLSKRLVIGAKALLVFASLFFYSWWNIIYLPLILTSMLFNYSVGNILSNKSKKIKINKKLLLIIGICANLSMLAYFKYADFFISNINFFIEDEYSLLSIALPLAISFFTFQQIAYLVDSYKDETKEYDFLNYALFVTFFPQLIAGPIVHHKEMMPQFASRWNLVKKYKNIATGLFIFTIGLFKKVVIADTFAVWATNGFDKAQTLNLVESWVTSLSYTYQLYFDFSGYTDMAIGAALLFNIRLPINFNSPYKAKDIQDFWRRWHMTLSRFMRDYIYIPLGGNKNGNTSACINVFSVALISGLWHGAGWTFVIWGAMHGIALVVHRIWKQLGFTMNSILAWFITFNFINITWIFFRAKEWDDAIKVLSGMFFGDVVLPYKFNEKFQFLSDFGVEFGNWMINIQGDNKTIIYVLLMLIPILAFKNTVYYRDNFNANKKTLIISTIFIIWTSLTFNKVSEFLYFNF